MKISLNWIKQFTQVDLGVDELVEKIGAQLGAVEEVVDVGARYKGIVVAKVVGCEKHPNADKLSLCKIDDGGVTPEVARGEHGHVQVVCGAPNVAKGQLVAWIPPGATVPSTYDKDPFVLEAREIRETVSNGMIASAHELGISDDRAGIVVIDIDVPPGTPLAEVYELNDYVIDIENKMFTHRPDCFGIIGVAREIAGIQNRAFKSPDWYLNPLDRIKLGKSKLLLEIRNETPELVPRFMAVAMAGVEVRPSPLIIQTYLSRIGLKPINNIVDATNYLMWLTGQPLHAYDADKLRKVSGNEDQITRLETRPSRKGDTLKLLGGKEITFEDDSSVLITSNDVPVGIGGVMGGADTEVDDSTKNIVLECANFDMYSVRKTAMRHGLFTDAVTRFTKGQSPWQNDRVLEESVATIQYVSGAHVASDVFDLVGKTEAPRVITATPEFINARLGLSLSADEMAQLLRNVEFDINVQGTSLYITPPFWRRDIHIPEDVVEEVGRLHGYDKLPLELPKRSISPVARNKDLDLKSYIRQALSRAGANEVLSYSFVHGDLLDKVGQDKEKAFRLSNALSPDLQYYRLSLTPSLLEKVHPNVKAGYDEFAIFEIGKAHSKFDTDENGLPGELTYVELVYTSKQPQPGAPYYRARRLAEQLLDELQIEHFVQQIEEGLYLQSMLPFERNRSGFIKAPSGATFGIVGELRTSVRRNFKLPDYTAALTLSLDALQHAYKIKASQYKPLSKYPKVEQDMTLRVKAELPFQGLENLVNKAVDKNTASTTMFIEVRPVGVYQKKGDPHKNVTFRFIVASYERTLTAQEVNNMLDSIADKAKEELGAGRV